MTKRKIIAICKLCLKRRPLQLSHLLPQGVSKRLSNPSGPIKDPILVTAKVTMSTSKQVRDHLLCSKCERLFDRNGENYVLRQMNDRGKFPLLDRLRISPAIDFSLQGASIQEQRLVWISRNSLISL